MIKDCLKDTDVVVLAGGRGTRVASVLKNKPKILAPLGKTQFIDLLLNLNSERGVTMTVSYTHLTLPTNREV